MLGCKKCKTKLSNKVYFYQFLQIPSGFRLFVFNFTVEFADLTREKEQRKKNPVGDFQFWYDTKSKNILLHYFSHLQSQFFQEQTVPMSEQMSNFLFFVYFLFEIRKDARKCFFLTFVHQQQ